MPVFLIDKIQQKNGGDFFLVDAEDVEVNGVSLTDKLKELENSSGSGDIESDQDFVSIFESVLGSSDTGTENSN